MAWLVFGIALSTTVALTGCGGDSHGAGDDAGAADSGGGIDAGPREDAPLPPRDTGPEPLDAGPPRDTGPGEEDAGMEPCAAPGTIETVSCGRCGSQDRFCTSAGFWEYTPCADAPGAECDPGSSMTSACGMCGTQRTLCDTSCRWVPGGACMGETGACLPGRTEIDRAGCPSGNIRSRTCADDCAWGAYGMCEPIPSDFDGDGVPYATDCDDTDPSVVLGSTRTCGVFRCVGATGPQSGTSTCMGPGWSACMRPATCTETATCSPMQFEREDCATECLPGPARTRSCTMGMWSAWTGCAGGRSMRPALCDEPAATSCGLCGEGVAYEICGRDCEPTSVGCTGRGCTPGATTRTTEGCAAGEFRESTCTIACEPGMPSACRPYPPDVDVIIAVDVTGSHTSLVMSNAATLANDLAATLLRDTDVRVGVALFADFPEEPYGAMGDVPFRGVLAPTSDRAMVEAALRGLPGMSGGDGPESGIEALWTLAGGAPHPEVEPFACPMGTGTGGCWRSGSQRIVVVVTDITQHNGPEIDGSGTIHDPYVGIDPAPATWPATRDLLRAAAVGVFGLAPTAGWAPEFDGAAQLEHMTTDLGQDPAISVVTYPAGATDWSAQVRTLADHIARYVGIAP